MAIVGAMTISNVVPIRGSVPQWTFAERVRKVRRDSGLKQEDFAALIGVKLKAYQAWETGKNNPGDLMGIVEKLEEVTGVTRIWFLGWADGKAPTEPEPDGGIDDGCARRYSKPQPSDPKVRPLLAVA